MNKNKKLLIVVILILLLIISGILYIKLSPCKTVSDSRNSGNSEIGICQMFNCYKHIITRECKIGCIKKPNIFWVNCMDDYT